MAKDRHVAPSLLVGRQVKEPKQRHQKQNTCLGQQNRSKHQQSHVRHDNRRKIANSTGPRRLNREQKQVLVFDQNDRVNYVKGFGKRKQERRERAKQEAIEKDREMRKLLRQKRREALNRSRSAAASAQGDDGSASNDDSDGYAGEEAKKD